LLPLSLRYLQKSFNMSKFFYIAPELTRFSFKAEAGFAVSDPDSFGLPGENPEVNDFGDF